MMSSESGAGVLPIKGSLGVGKRLPTAVYVHESLLPQLPQRLRHVILAAREKTREPLSWNVAKLGTTQPVLSLLSYTSFDEHAFPQLAASLTLNVETGEKTERRYPPGDTAPILHRKELLVPNDYPLREDFAAITQELEAAGAFRETKSIGRLGPWRERLKECGFALIDGRVLPAKVFEGPGAWDAQRGRTALVRSAPSLPMQALERQGWLDGRFSVFDYGCGHGYDVEYLAHLGVTAGGWDPVHKPRGQRVRADIVNLGFVINVIEEPEERRAVLESAFALADQLFVASAMVAPPSHYEKFAPFRDGVVTSRGTFQKYFTQGELREYVATATGREAYGLGPGIVVAFTSETLRESFLEGRFRRRAAPGQHGGPKAPPSRRSKAADFYKRHPDACASVWKRACDLGRWPEADEIVESALLREEFASPKRAYHAISRFFDSRELEEAARRRREDLIVEDVLALFERRSRRPSDFSIAKQRDVRALFGSYSAVRQKSGGCLKDIADGDVLREAALALDRAHCGGFLDESGISVERRCVDRLPLPLRAYVELGAAYNGGLVIPPFLRVGRNRTQAALASFCAGVMPPSAMFGRSWL